MKYRTTAFLLASLLSISLGARTKTEITYYTPEIVRIVKYPSGLASSPERNSVVVTATPAAVKNPAVKVKTDPKTGALTFTDSRGKVLLREAESSLQAITEGVDKGYYVATQGWMIPSEEPIYGLGMLQNGKMSQRGENREMVQNNTEDYCNFFQSVKGYGIYWDNYSPTNISDDGNTLTLSSQVGEMIDYYFIYGGDADGVIKGMRTLTGEVPMLPLWTYGFHQSRERYKSQDELLDALHGYRNAGIPIDGIIQDWQYWGSNYNWNAMEFLNDSFYNPQAMIDEVHAQNAHISISIWQSFGPETKQFKELAEKGLMMNFSTWPQSGVAGWPPRMDYPSGVRCLDVYSSEARDIYWKHLTRLHNMDIDAWWMDSTDPDHMYVEGDFDEMTSMGSFRSVRNIFPLMIVEGVYDHQRATSDHKRVFILTRSYFAGQQRTGANTWSGDVVSSWDSFRKQIPLCLNYTMTGNPNVNSDIGGFFPGTYNKPGQTATCAQNPLFQELYVRWLQFGLFCPMMRSHGESSRREIREFGKPGEPVYDAIAGTIRMRYSLIPYIYSTSWQVTSNSDSFMRALVMDFKADKNVWDINDEFMFGRSLLVAPVTEAKFTCEDRRWSDEAADWSIKADREVYLPSGAVWYDWYTGDRFNGGQTVKAPAPLDKCPLYARGGSIVPVGPDVQYAQASLGADLEIRVYPGADGTFTLYEDEGDNYNYEKGLYSTITFKWNDKKNVLTIGARSGGYEGMAASRRFTVKVAGKDGARTVEYNGNELKVNLK